MKRILCFGDSNTWGYDPATGERLDEGTRWTRVTAKCLGDGFEIIEEGLCGRTTVWDDPIEEYRNGKEYLYPCLETHCPVDLVVILLGTNDLKRRFSLSAFDIAQGAGVLVEIVGRSEAGRGGRAPAVLLLAPPPTAKFTEEFVEMFEGAEAKSAKFAELYARIAKQFGCAFLDTAAAIVSSPLDGIHLEASEHAKLGKIVAEKVVKLLE